MSVDVVMTISYNLYSQSLLLLFTHVKLYNRSK